jgi:hypothetical protein
MVRIVSSLIHCCVQRWDWKYSGRVCVVMYQLDDVGEKIML